MKSVVKRIIKTELSGRSRAKVLSENLSLASAIAIIVAGGGVIYRLHDQLHLDKLSALIQGIAVSLVGLGFLFWNSVHFIHEWKMSAVKRFNRPDWLGVLVVPGYLIMVWYGILPSVSAKVGLLHS